MSTIYTPDDNPPNGYTLPADLPDYSVDTYKWAAVASIGMTIVFLIWLIIAFAMDRDRSEQIAAGIFTGLFGIIAIGSVMKYMKWRPKN